MADLGSFLGAAGLGGAIGQAVLRLELDSSTYLAELEPGLHANVYGSSFRFQVMREEIDERPSRSSYNPDGLIRIGQRNGGSAFGGWE